LFDTLNGKIFQLSVSQISERSFGYRWPKFLILVWLMLLLWEVLLLLCYVDVVINVLFPALF